MTDIEQAQEQQPQRDPRIWNPFTEMEAWTNRIGTRPTLFRPEWPMIDGVDFTPVADIEETDTAWTVEVELPGVKKKDLTVETHGRTVVITGERKEKEREGVLRQRRRVMGSFRYEVTLPSDIDVDGIDASLHHGELVVTVPKQSHQQPRKVKIN
jgi:HSP20 family protein